MDLNGDGVLVGIESIFSYVLAASAIIVAIGIIWSKVLKPVYRSVSKMVKRTNMFLDDWYGDEHTPGVMARIDSLERDLEQVRNQVVSELNRNGGESTKDAAVMALKAVREVQFQQEQEIRERKHLTDHLERILQIRLDTPEDHPRQP